MSAITHKIRFYSIRNLRDYRAGIGVTVGISVVVGLCGDVASRCWWLAIALCQSGGVARSASTSSAVWWVGGGVVWAKVGISLLASVGLRVGSVARCVAVVVGGGGRCNIP